MWWRTVVEPAGQRLAGAVAVQAMFVAFGDARDQRGAFDQALRVDHHVVTAFLQRALEVAALLPGVGAENHALAPAANRHRDHAVNRRMPGGDLREAFFHHPVKTNAGNGLHGVRQRGQRMQHIPHRGGFNDQYPHALSFFAGNRVTASALPTRAAAEYRSGSDGSLLRHRLYAPCGSR